MDKQKESFMLFTLMIVSLLASVSLLGMKNTIQSTHLAQSYHSYYFAIERAESALSAANKSINGQREYKLDSLNKPLGKGLYPQFIESDNLTYSAWQFVKARNLWRQPEYTVVQTDGENKEFISSYIIEKLNSSQSDYLLYRITAMAVGLSQDSSVVLQSLVMAGGEKRRLSWTILH